LRKAYWAGITAAIAMAIIYAFQGYYPDFMFIFSNAFAPFCASIAVASSFFALRRYWENPSSRLSRIWLGFTLGMFLWFLGELGWAIYVLVLGIEIPYPSLADLFWLCGYIPLFIALDLYIRLFRPALFKRMYLVGAALVSILSITLFIVLAPPILEAEEDALTKIVSMAYPSLDLILFSEAILGLLIFTVTRLKGGIGVAWLFINAGILMNVIADILFSYTTLQGTYYDGHPLELFFHWGYMLFTLAFYTHMKEL